MRVLRTQSDARAAVASARRSAAAVALVPTLGALHDGHRALLRAARERGGVVALSMFVNPLQFGPHEDFTAYPRHEETDLGVAADEGCDLVFAPAAEEMGMESITTTIAVGRLGEVLEGAERPGHFVGVCAVVAKLLNILSPDALFLGQKDAQQNAVLRRMTTDLSFGCELVICPTVRAPDGLALSSRNAYLSDEDRAQATGLYRALVAGRARYLEGGSLVAAEDVMHDALASAGIVPDYARAVDPVTFDAPEGTGRVLLAVAGRVGPARLIDNLLVDPPQKAPAEAGEGIAGAPRR
jgi:pantoate--beta-alanine ligase